MSNQSSNTSYFIDLASFDVLEQYLYGGSKSITYFSRAVRKSTWFVKTPLLLGDTTGSQDFGQIWSARISRAGDFLLSVFLRVVIPQVTLLAGNQFTTNGRIRWTRNLMHNLIHYCDITFNDLSAMSFDQYTLDFWTMFMMDPGKQQGYSNMTGNVSLLTNPTTSDSYLPQIVLNLPLPFFFSRDSGVSLPVVALPYNDIRINFQFNTWQSLLLIDNITDESLTTVPVIPTDIAAAPSLVSTTISPQAWAVYAIVNSEERISAVNTERDILIEQFTTAPVFPFVPITNSVSQYDIHFANAVKCLFFSIRNITRTNEQSNYTTASPVANASSIIYTPYPTAADPMLYVSLLYENVQRLTQMNADYFSLMEPYYFADAMPDITGYHLYSYALHIGSLDPTGSSNYGKLSKVSMIIQGSAPAVTAYAGGGAHGTGIRAAQRYEFICVGVSMTIVRVGGGGLSFPV